MVKRKTISSVMWPVLALGAAGAALWYRYGGAMGQYYVKKYGSTVPAFHPIADKYRTYAELHQALRRAGVESSNLIVGIDFTRSNEQSGMRTFCGASLHSLHPTVLNPYQSVIATIGQTLEVFDDDKLIPAYGFGDQRTRDRSVFSLMPDETSCQGFQVCCFLSPWVGDG